MPAPPFRPLGRADLSHLRPTNLPRFLYGVCYYPEHWDAATRENDAARMAAAGFNVARMAEFAWDILEPEEGRFNFALFDETIARLAAHGIDTLLGTPTASPPRWLTAKYPETLRTASDGTRMQPGSRQHASYASPVFREKSRAITRAMAEHYRKNPHVIGWQTDNELYCHFHDDHGAEIHTAFRAFLRRIYADDLDALNRAWGNAFWAQTIRAWDEIQTPIPCRPTYPNPSASLDYARFLSDVVERFQHDQVEILRAAGPHWLIFHNGIMPKTRYRGPFSQDLDFLGFDIYPFFCHDPRTRPAAHAFNCDRARGYAGNYIVPEHQAGAGSQADYAHNAPEPGEMRLFALSSIARGADSLLFFRWRTCRFGAEMYWTGILDHDDVPRRRYHEAARLGAELATLGPLLLGTSVECDTAVAACDYDVREAHATYPVGLPGPDSVAEHIHRALWEAGCAVGCVHPLDDLSRLRLYIIPHWAYFDLAWVAPLERFVEKGGTLVLGARTATRDTRNHVIAETPPGPLRVLAGCSVAEYTRENPEAVRDKHIAWESGRVEAECWSEILTPDPGAETAGLWDGRHYTGSPAMVLQRRGAGKTITVGTFLTTPAITALLPWLAEQAGIAPLPGAKRGLSYVRRSGAGRTLLFVLNHTGDDTPAEVPPSRDAISGKPHSGGKVFLRRHDARIFLLP